ncbi:unnamed protein product [Phyllotreta striolata]|uniref:Uncharacterized protein n=1 Tax=Phyllotreta striolata TaxID=444603 RepID=A0A9N9TJI0_PHYSR|nr:unnamed protein product [Phyllotreta striolata]
MHYLSISTAIASCYAGTAQVETRLLGCTCPNLLTGVANLITQLQATLGPLLTQLGGLGSFVNQILELVKNLVIQLGNALANGGLLGGLNNLVSGLLGQLGINISQ